MKEKIGFAVEGLQLVGLLGLAGGTLLYKGMKKHRLRRRILDIPRSNIKSAAIGALVEVMGEVKPHKEIISPVGKKECTAFILKFERHDTDKNGRTIWRHISTIHSDPYLILGDDEGYNFALELSQAKVLDETQEIEYQFRYDEINNEALETILNSLGVLPQDSPGRFFLGITHRVVEYSFQKGEQYFLFGSAHPPRELRNYIKNPKIDFLKNTYEVRKNIDKEANNRLQYPEHIRKVDKNKDGYLTQDEVDILRSEIRKEIAQEEEENPIEYPFDIKFIMSHTPKGSLSFVTNEVMVSKQGEDLAVKSVSKKMFSSLFWGYFLLILSVIALVFLTYLLIKFD